MSAQAKPAWVNGSKIAPSPIRGGPIHSVRSPHPIFPQAEKGADTGTEQILIRTPVVQGNPEGQATPH